MASGYDYYPASHQLHQYGDGYFLHNNTTTNSSGYDTSSLRQGHGAPSDCMYNSPPGIFNPSNYHATHTSNYQIPSYYNNSNGNSYLWHGAYSFSNNPTATFGESPAPQGESPSFIGYSQPNPVVGSVSDTSTITAFGSTTTITNLDNSATTCNSFNSNDHPANSCSIERNDDSIKHPSPDSTTIDPYDPVSSSCEMSDTKFQDSSDHQVTPTNNPYCLYGNTNMTSWDNSLTKQPQTDDVIGKISNVNHQNQSNYYNHPYYYHSHYTQPLSTKPPGPYKTMREYFTKSRRARRNLKNMAEVSTTSGTIEQKYSLPSSACRVESSNGVYDSLSVPNSERVEIGTTLVTKGNGTFTTEGNGTFTTEGNGTFTTEGNGTFTTEGNGTFTTEGNGPFTTEGNGTFTTEGNGTFTTEENGTLNVERNVNVNVDENTTFNSKGSRTPKDKGNKKCSNKKNNTLASTEEINGGISSSASQDNTCLSKNCEDKTNDQKSVHQNTCKETDKFEKDEKLKVSQNPMSPSTVKFVQQQQNETAKDVGKKNCSKSKHNEVANLGVLVGAPVLYTEPNDHFLYQTKSANNGPKGGQIPISVLCCKCHISKSSGPKSLSSSILSPLSSSSSSSSLPFPSSISSPSLVYENQISKNEPSSEDEIGSGAKFPIDENCCSTEQKLLLHDAQSSLSSKEKVNKQPMNRKRRKGVMCVGRDEDQKGCEKSDEQTSECEKKDGGYVERGIIIKTCGDVIKMEHDVKDEGSFVLQDEKELGCHLCLGCQKPVCDRYVLHVRDHGYWHADCLKCSNCQDNLSTHKSCYVKNEQVFCRNDYNILFGQSCVKCSLQFKKEQDWMRVAGQNRYHIACFLCKICKRQLGNNEKYHLVNGTDIYCTNHYRDMVSGDSSEEGQQPAKKAKRNRTSYTEAQIKFLQERFLHDSNPDGNELEKIANHINLKKRVVQVWFQNNRARLKKSANNTKGSNPDNSGQANSNGRVSTPGGQSEAALSMDWDNSLDPSTLEDQGYISPNTTTANIGTPTHLLHQHQQQQISPSGPHYPDLYGLPGALNPHVLNTSPGHHSSDHNGLGGGMCGPNGDQQISPEFTDVNPGSFHGSDMTLNPTQSGTGVNGTDISSSGGNSNCSESHKNEDTNISSTNDENGMNFDPDKAYSLNSLRNSFASEKYLDNFRRMDSRERHEQQIRQMMQYHEHQQQQQHQQHPYHYQHHFLPNHMPLYPSSSFGLPYTTPYGVPPYSTSPLSHGMMENGCPSPNSLAEMPQNFLQQQQQQHQTNPYNDKDSHIQEHFQQHQGPPGLQMSPRNKKGSGNNNNNDCSINNNNNKNKSIFDQNQKHPGDVFEDQVVSSSFFPSKNLTVPSHQTTLPVNNPQSGTSPSHFNSAQKAPSPGDFSKNEGYRSPLSFGRSGIHPYQFIHVPHGQRDMSAGDGHYFGNGVDSVGQRNGNGYLMDNETSNDES